MVATGGIPSKNHSTYEYRSLICGEECCSELSERYYCRVWSSSSSFGVIIVVVVVVVVVV